MGLHVANLVMALDPGIFIIGGGLMDLESTTVEFRERYMRNIRDTAAPHLSGRPSGGTRSKLFPPFWVTCRKPSVPHSSHFTKARSRSARSWMFS